MSYTIRDCPLCGGHDFSPLLKARDFHYGNLGEFQMVQCTRCSLAFLDPMYDDEELSNFYPRHYYSFEERLSPTTQSSWRKAIWKLVGVPEHGTKDPEFERPGRMLDVGCGSGWHLAKMRALGWDVTGVEPSASAAMLGQSKHGLNIFPGSLPDAKLAFESFDYIRFNHSFEHVSDPNKTLVEVHRILARKGKLMIGVPNLAGVNAKLFGRFWWHLALPLHAFSYSTKTLSLMLAKHGFKVEGIVFNTERTAIQGSLQLFLNRKDTPLSTQGRIVQSRLIGVLSAWAAHLQNAIHIADVIEIVAVKK
jgi:SAM-dependent methyltransferase